MAEHRIYSMTFQDIRDAYVNKVARKEHNTRDVDVLICWLTGYTESCLDEIAQGTVKEFFANAPAWNPRSEFVTGSICGVKIQELEDPLMKQIRILDKLIDELATGRPMHKILREDVAK